MSSAEQQRRWRLVLGRYAQRDLQPLSQTDTDLDAALSFVYDRGYEDRGLVTPHTGGRTSRGITALSWLEKSKALFPESTYVRLQSTAITEYGVTELLRDPSVADQLEPTPELGAALLAARGTLDPSTAAGMRTVITKVVEEIVARLHSSFRSQLIGSRNRFRRSQQKVRQNFDWRASLRANLSHIDQESGRMIVSELRFNSRQRRHLPWHVILCVDQSGSMATSVLYAAICASILAALPGIDVTLLVFDTRVVDLTHLASDPVSVLMTAQLGGGTDIAGALGVAQTKIVTPQRTVLTLVSDFDEGGSVSRLLSTVRQLREQGVTLLGLAALDEAAQPRFDRAMADRLADRGMEIAALTPDRFAQWLAEVMR